MTAAQMYNEFEIAYEAIAGADAPGYDPYSVSIILSQAQDRVVKTLMASGIENDDDKSLILGPFIETDMYSSFSSSSMYPDTFVFEVDQSSHWGIINERLVETGSSGTVEVRPIDHAFFEANRDNPYKKPDSTRYFWRFIEKGPGGTAYWFVYGPTNIQAYYINYLEKPTPIIVPGVALSTNIDGTTVTSTIVTDGLDCGFSTRIHRDIVLTAARMAKVFIGDVEGSQLLAI